MTARFIPPTIKSEGLEHYLNRTKADHDGYGYKTFCKEVAKPKQTNAAIARMFNVDPRTFAKWKRVHQAEIKEAADEAAVDALTDV